MTSSLTFLGFDYGTRNIGIAVGQRLTRTARDLDTVKVRGTTPDWNRIADHISTWQPCALVVGIPLNGDGEETRMSGKARKFGRVLSDRYNLPVHCVNEYLTSESARQVLSLEPGKNIRRKDQVAARLILESFFNEQHEPGRNKNSDD